MSMALRKRGMTHGSGRARASLLVALHQVSSAQQGTHSTDGTLAEAEESSELQPCSCFM